MNTETKPIPVAVPHTIEETAAHFGLSYEVTRQTELRALRKLSRSVELKDIFTLMTGKRSKPAPDDNLSGVVSSHYARISEDMRLTV